MKKQMRGQSLVEFALLLPLLLMLLMGLLDLGRVYYVAVALHDAADEGANYASIRPSDTAGIQSRAAAASGGLVQINQASVEVMRPSPLAAGMPITVSVRHEFDFYTPFVSSFFQDGKLTLRGNASHPIITVR